MSFSIILADLQKEKGEILALWRRNSRNLTEKRYAWLYENNPHGPPICFLALERKLGAIIGSTTLFPRKIVIRGKTYLAAVAGDFVVDRSFRGFGPAFALQKATMTAPEARKFEMLYGFSTPLSAPISQRGGWKVLGRAMRLTKVLRSYSYFKKYVNLPVATRTFSHAVDFALRYSSKEIRYKTADGYSHEILSDFDSRFDDLWKSVFSRFPAVAERTSVYLKWRYKQDPFRDYQIFVLGHLHDHSIFGYVVYYVDEENCSQIVDFMSLDDEGTQHALIAEFLLHLRRERINAASIRYLGRDVLIHKFMEFGFWRRGQDFGIDLYLFPHSEIPFEALDAPNWHLLAGDRDI